MIQSLAELLDAIRTKEAAALDRYNIQHPTIIGNMYEGLTRRLIRGSVFSGLELRVVDGKIAGADGTLSDQIDCMLVEGRGDPIPYTESFVYSVEQVIAVIEVKKNLYSEGLKGAYFNLRTVSDLTGQATGSLGLARSAFRAIAGQDASATDIPSLSKPLQMLFGCLAKDSLAPARIVMGYFGFATERSLRDAFVKYLQNEIAKAAEEGKPGAKGFGPASCPNLILCRDSALVKLNAMPYGSPLVDQLAIAPSADRDGWWPFYASMPGRNSLALLEIIWTRLRNRYALPSSIFGEDMEVEVLTPLLFAKPVPGRGWDFLSHEVDDSRLISRIVDWEPAVITEIQSAALSYLGAEGEVDIDSEEFAKFAGLAQVAKEQFLQDLLSTNLVFIDAQRRLRFLTYGCDTVFLPDGRIVAGENSTGRLTRWALKQSPPKQQ
jgi:hypothetical protein